MQSGKETGKERGKEGEKERRERVHVKEEERDRRREPFKIHTSKLKAVGQAGRARAVRG